MADCKGFFGRIFGHDFQRFLVKDGVKLTGGDYMTISGVSDIVEYVEACRCVYEIRCKRCGVTPEVK